VSFDPFSPFFRGDAVLDFTFWNRSTLVSFDFRDFPISLLQDIPGDAAGG